MRKFKYVQVILKVRTERIAAADQHTMSRGPKVKNLSTGTHITRYKSNAKTMH